MQPFVQLCLSSLWIGWTNSGAIALTAILYFRGWSQLHRILPERYSRFELVAFLTGMAAIWIALSPSLEALSALLLAAHMIQHLLLLAVAPPLLLLGRPILPILRGLPRSLAHDGIAPFLQSAVARKLQASLSRPLPCWLAFVGTLILWHLPAAFDIALRSSGWHHLEHVCFLGSSLLFWGQIIRPSASGNDDSVWILPVYLLAADIVNTALSAVLTFSDRLLYSPYASVPRLFGTTPLTDQVAAGVIMWVPGSLFFLGPAFFIAWRQAFSRGLLTQPIRSAHKATIHRPASKLQHATSKPIDLLKWPILGTLLRRGFLRRAIQVVLFILAIAIIASGFGGLREPGANLACVLPWTYWRFFAVAGIAIAGNLSCMVCPFTLPREVGRRRAGRHRPWPRILRTKWLAVGLLLVFVWAYEVFSPWELPAATAALVLVYFSGSYVVSRFFEGASFCRYICPIGQFQFVGSLASPFEVKIHSLDACVSCKTHDCMKGNADGPGCEMGLHLPAKQGNMDCTFCLDCVRACPHQNIGLIGGPPGSGLIGNSARSSLARLSSRSDVAALAIVFVFAAFANAAAMTGWAAAWRDRVTHHIGLISTVPATTIFFLVTLIVLPASLIGGSAAIGLALSRPNRNFGDIARKFALALVPLGLAMWTAHLLFHFAVGWNSIVPMIRALAAFSGIRHEGPVDVTSPLLSADSLLRLQTSMLGIGLLASLYAGWRLARRIQKAFLRVLLLVAPWSVACVCLYLSGIWILMQPMAMGTAIAQEIATR